MSTMIQIEKVRQSELGTLLACGRKWELDRLMGQQSFGNRKTVTGTAYHLSLENVYRSLMMGDRVDWDEAHLQGQQKLVKDLILAPAQALDLQPGEDLEGLVNTRREYLQKAVEFHRENIFPEIFSKGRPQAVEELLTIEYRGITLTGTIDLMDGAGVLRDHKLTNAHLDKTMPSSYWSQLARYAWFWTMVMGFPPERVQIDMVSIARLKNKDPKTRVVKYAAYPEDNIKRLLRHGEESTNQAIDQLKMGLFPRNAANTYKGMCGYCDHAGAVCMGDEDAA